VGTHAGHWDYFTKLVGGSTAPFALLRYVDGERMILQGTQVSSSSQAGSEDKWWYDGGETILAQDMAAGLKGHYGEPYFFAFASPQDDDAGLKWYMERTEAQCGQITYANLWINGYYTRTKPFLLETLRTQAKRIILVANHEGVDKFEPCTTAGTDAPGGLLGCISLPDQAVYTWEEESKRKAILDAMLGWAASAPPGSLFIMCGGPLSKPLIAAAWTAFPVHQYVDFGSSLDEVLKGRTTRPCELLSPLCLPHAPCARLPFAIIFFLIHTRAHTRARALTCTHLPSTPTLLPPHTHLCTPARHAARNTLF